MVAGELAVAMLPEVRQSVARLDIEDTDAVSAALAEIPGRVNTNGLLRCRTGRVLGPLLGPAGGCGRRGQGGAVDENAF